ncbi:class III lanthionine synthetase LanKC [Amycolatopsis lurida]
MDMRYQEYCFADPLFYDSPDRWAVQENSFSEALRAAPDGWLQAHKNSWLFLAPKDLMLPQQGWKIHISTSLDDAEGVLKVVYDYCVENRISFKFLPTSSLLIARNLKYADRGGSGKFITIYPADVSVLERVGNDLAQALDGKRGPYVLSDLRWGAGPVYVRYGGFMERYCRDEYGELALAIEDPDGNLVPDDRQPVFQPPPWIELPGFLAEHRAALGGKEAPPGFPYKIERALHFSNGGGIYLAEDTRSGEQVVLKEARPYAGLDPHGMDAVGRLERERDFLADLADVEEVVNAFEHFVLWEHSFLVQEYVEGQTLNKAVMERYPLIRAARDDAAIAEFTEWVLGILDQVEAGITALHARGITFGDLHPNNIMVRPDGRVAFIDFEMSYRDGEVAKAGVGAPGYVPPDGRTGPALDRYALACLKLAVFLPLTMLFPLGPNKAELLAAAVDERFPVPAGYGDRVLREINLKPAEHGGTTTQRQTVAELVGTLDTGQPDWPALQDSIAAAILTSATPERTDRLFPGDIQQFVTNGLGLAYGAAGVLYALSATGYGRHPEHEEWLLRAVRAGGTERAIGFYDGLHGVAFALDHLGRADDAAELLDKAMTVPFADLPSDLFSGLAGVGLNLLHFAERRGSNALLGTALTVADLLAERLVALPEPVITEAGSALTPTGKAGLMRGTTGQALFFIRLFERTQDARYLDLARQALDHDLRYCLLLEQDGTVQLNEGWRVLPYVASGSVGIGLVIQDYLRHHHVPEFAEKLTGMRRAAEPEFIIGSTLFNGRAGLIAFLSRLRDADGPDADLDVVIDMHMRRLAWHAVAFQGHVAFPGEQLLRLSMDLGSGNAGVLMALQCALGNGSAEHAMLPFLGRLSPVPAPVAAAAS